MSSATMERSSSWLRRTSQPPRSFSLGMRARRGLRSRSLTSQSTFRTSLLSQTACPNNSWSTEPSQPSARTQRNKKESSFPLTSKTCMNLNAKELKRQENQPLTTNCGLPSMGDTEATSACLACRSLTSGGSRIRSASTEKRWRDRSSSSSARALTWTMSATLAM